MTVATRALVLIARAIGEAAAIGDGRSGVFVADPTGWHAEAAVRLIADALGHRVEILDSARTNLNDLDIAHSPLGGMARAADDGTPTLLVLRGWHADMAGDPRVQSLRRWFGGNGTLVVIARGNDGIPRNHVAVDISGITA